MLKTRKTEVEKKLEAAVFGNEDFFDNFASDSDEDDQIATIPKDDGDNYGGLDDDQLFMVDDQPEDVSDESSAESGDDMEVDIQELRPAAWHDSDDEKLEVSLATAPRLRKLRRNESEDLVSGIEYAKRLRAQFERVYPVPDWALPLQQRKKKKRRTSSQSSGSDTDASMDDNIIALSADPMKALLQSSASFIQSGKPSVKLPGKLDIKRLRDANHQEPSHSAIQTISFHPSLPLLMTGGYDRTLRIYHIDGKVNTLASSLHLRNVPIESAIFHPDGKRIFIGGSRRYFHIWNLETGQVQKISRVYGHQGHSSTMEKFSISEDGSIIALVAKGGWINFLSSETGQFIDAVKVTGGISDIVFSTSILIIATKGSEIWEYDTHQSRIIARWSDDGGTNTSKLAIGGAFLAIGSRSGIVNIYRERKLIKTIPSITTRIHDMRFSKDCQVLAITSRAKRDCMKMIHVPSFATYQNWPTQSTPLGKIGAVAFSANSEMFAVGNQSGRVTLWSI